MLMGLCRPESRGTFAKCRFPYSRRTARAASLWCLSGFLVQAGVATETQQVPSFGLRDLAGKRVVLEEVLKTGPVMIVFWATCCSGTHGLMVHLDLLQKRYSEKGFTVLAIAVDDTKTASRVRPWVLARRLTYPVLLDPAGDVMRLCHVTATPYTLLVDQQRRIVASHAGFLPGDEQVHEREVRELLGIEDVGG